MKKILFIIFSIVIFITGKSQVNQYGYPLYTFYGSDILNSSAQNWGIVRANNGLLYIANNINGVLEYDGETSRSIAVDGNPEIRAVAINKDGLIFVGGSYEFGYLRPNNLGAYSYTSLSSRLSDSLNKFSLIYNVNCIADSVYFSDDQWNLYKYVTSLDTLEIIKNKKNTLFTFNCNNTIYGGSYTEGLFKIVGDSSVLVSNGDFFKNKNIFSILNDNNNMAIVTGNSGVFKMDENSNDIKPILSGESYSKIKDAVVYSADLNAKSYFLGTIGNGINVLDKQGNLEAILDKEIGIQDHISTSVNSINNILWGTLTIGITGVEYSNPIRYFSEETRLLGGINDITSFDNKLFVGTDVGVFYLDLDKTERVFKKLKGISNQVWSFSKMSINSTGKEFLVIGTGEGLYQFNNISEQVVLIERDLGGLDLLFPELNKQELQTATSYVWKLFSSTGSNKLWVGTLNRIFSIDFINGQWNVVNPILDIGDKIKDITDDELGNLWISTTQGGVFFYDINKRQLNNKNNSLGLTDLDNIRINKIDGRIVFATGNGIYALSEQNDSLRLLNEFPTKFSNNDNKILLLKQLSNKKVVINFASKAGSKIEALVNIDGTIFKPCDAFLKRLPNISTETFYEFKQRLWFSNGNILYNIPIENNFVMDSIFNCLIRKVEGDDSVYFYGTFYKENVLGLLPSNIQNEKQKPILGYADNNLTFYFAAPFFEGVDEIEYSYLLKGYKTEWSKWNKEPKAVFTNLNEGQYTFQVKAKNIYGMESTVGAYSFTVLPPWYRTILAYFLYAALALWIVWIIVRLYTRKLKQEKIWLEGVILARTAEIREQRDEIAEQKHSIESSIVYARRIQRAILPSDELANEILPEHFILFRPRDIVSGDYFWMNKIGNHTIIVAADCTGHGVPGAFMSMLGVSFLNEIVLKDSIIEPHLILNKLRERVKKTLKQEGKDGEAKDGMDVAVVVFDDTNNKLYYAGAYNPAYIFRGKELFELKGDRMPIGIYIKEKESFTLNEFDYQKGDTFYIFSDGYPDQFGGPKKEKLKTKALKEFLESIQDKSMMEQGKLLNQNIEDWMGSDQEQIDDMVMIGVRL